MKGETVIALLNSHLSYPVPLSQVYFVPSVAQNVPRHDCSCIFVLISVTPLCLRSLNNDHGSVSVRPQSRQSTSLSCYLRPEAQLVKTEVSSEAFHMYVNTVTACRLQQLWNEFLKIFGVCFLCCLLLQSPLCNCPTLTLFVLTFWSWQLCSLLYSFFFFSPTLSYILCPSWKWKGKSVFW